MNKVQNKVGVIVAGLLLAILMASKDNTIVATAMGTIVGEMGSTNSYGLHLLIWLRRWSCLMWSHPRTEER